MPLPFSMALANAPDMPRESDSFNFGPPCSMAKLNELGWQLPETFTLDSKSLSPETGLSSVAVDGTLSNLDGGLKIPSFRRLVSFVGQDQGFDLFCPQLDEAPSVPELNSPPPCLDLDYEHNAEPHVSKVCLDQACSSSSGLNFDAVYVSGDFILGAIPSTRLKQRRAAHVNDLDIPPVDNATQSFAGIPDNEVSLTSSPADDDSKLVGQYTKAERRQKILRYKEKRKRSSFEKRIIYACRKRFADRRPRIGGRFIKLSDAPLLPSAVKREHSHVDETMNSTRNKLHNRTKAQWSGMHPLPHTSLETSPEASDLHDGRLDLGSELILQSNAYYMPEPHLSACKPGA